MPIWCFFFFNFTIHTTKNGSKNLKSATFSEKIVMKLIKHYLGKGHHLLMNNFYIIVSLTDLLLKKKNKITRDS